MRRVNHSSSFERAMTSFRSFLPCVLLATGAACHGDAVTNSPVIPTAAIHFVNAVPDTNRMDFRVVDIVSNAGLFGASFRSANMFYTGIEAGARRIRVFYDTTDVTIAQTVFSDTAYTYVATQSYTFIEAGFARGGVPARAVSIVPDNAADPGANNVGLRLIHAGAGIGNIDVFLIRRQQDTLALPATTASNVAFGAVGAYVAVAADTGAQTLRVVVTATGTTTPILANVALPTGTAGTPTVNPIAGARVPGSVLTAVLVPASVVGSGAPQGGAFARPNAVLLVDRRPANTAP
jgi:hypothetical protein